MTSLSDTQRILLSTASQRDSGSILPLPACLKPGGGTTKAFEALISRKFADERETTDPAEIRRTEEDVRYGLFVTPAGLAAIGVGPDAGAMLPLGVRRTLLPPLPAPARPPPCSTFSTALTAQPCPS